LLEPGHPPEQLTALWFSGYSRGVRAQLRLVSIHKSAGKAVHEGEDQWNMWQPYDVGTGTAIVRGHGVMKMKLRNTYDGAVTINVSVKA
jgi:hypothetical protein